MDRYYCVFKMKGQTTPTSVSFESQHTGTAILKLMELAKVQNTLDIEEAEILKHVKDEDGKPGYIKVFVKEKKDAKGRAIIKHNPPVIKRASNVVPIDINKKVVDEAIDVYVKPYKVEVL